MGDGDRILIPTEEDLPHPLGRHIWHDPLNRLYQAPQGAVRDVAWKFHRSTPLDQGRTNGCTAGALLQCLLTSPLWDGSWQFDNNLLLELYARITQVDPFPGTFSFPPPGGQDTGSNGDSAAKVGHEHGWVTTWSHPFGLEAVKGAVSLSPVMLGLPWFASMFEVDRNGYLQVSGGQVGGHEIVLACWDMANRRGGIITDWDVWGIAIPGVAPTGCAWITEDNLYNLLAQQGDATVLHTAAVPPPPPPAPPPSPVPMPPPVVAHPYPGTPIRSGMRNQYVTAIQQRLQQLGFVQPVTGYFGVTTWSNVAGYQRARGISVVGYVGPATWAALFG